MAGPLQAHRSAESVEVIAAHSPGAVCSLNEDAMMHRASLACAALVAAVTLTSCVRVKAPASQPSHGVPGMSLWKAPADLATRDLFYGPWGREHAPDPDATYTLVELKHSGVNPGMTVRDPQGRE